MKKILGLLAICSTTILCAVDPIDKNTSKQLYFSNDQSIAVTPEAGPQTMRAWNPFITADFIYWTAREDGMFHAVSGVGPNVGKGHVYGLEWKWNPGFKVGIGCNLPHDGWDLQTEYTWIQSSAKGTTNQDPATTNLVSYWSINGAPLQALSMSHANWKLHFNDVHLELGRNSYLSQYLKVRIHAGLQSAWINQDYEVTQTVAKDSSTNRLSLDQDFWGIGLRSGLDTAWQFNHNLSFFADFALSILWGQFDLDRLDRNIKGGISTTHVNTGVSPHTFEPVLTFGAGLKWDTWLSGGDYHILLQAGWDHQLWILQNEFIKVPTETDHIGDLVLQGLTIKARFDF